MQPQKMVLKVTKVMKHKQPEALLLALQIGRPTPTIATKGPQSGRPTEDLATCFDTMLI
jgi:hypothetical protein